MLADEGMESEAVPHFRATIHGFETIYGVNNLQTVSKQTALAEALLVAVVAEYHAGKRQAEITTLQKKAAEQQTKVERLSKLKGKEGKRAELELELCETTGKMKRLATKNVSADGGRSGRRESLAQSLEDPNKAVGKTAEQVERLVEDEAEALMLRSLPVFQDAEDWEQCSLTANNLSNLYANQKRKKRGKGDAEADRHF
jgi:hypothetical protein